LLDFNLWCVRRDKDGKKKKKDADDEGSNEGSADANGVDDDEDEDEDDVVWITDTSEAAAKVSALCMVPLFRSRALLCFLVRILGSPCEARCLVFEAHSAGAPVENLTSQAWLSCMSDNLTADGHAIVTQARAELQLSAAMSSMVTVGNIEAEAQERRKREAEQKAKEEAARKVWVLSTVLSVLRVPKRTPSFVIACDDRVIGIGILDACVDPARLSICRPRRSASASRRRPARRPLARRPRSWLATQCCACASSSPPALTPRTSWPS
jgi:hypothetical protein